MEIVFSFGQLQLHNGKLMQVCNIEGIRGMWMPVV